MQAHVRNEIARFNQVEGVTDSNAMSRLLDIQKAANHFGIKMKETDWHQLARATLRWPTVVRRHALAPAS